MPNHETEEPLRFRRCHNAECNALFTICPCCDRGQRYCGSACRQRARRAQVAAPGGVIKRQTQEGQLTFSDNLGTGTVPPSRA